MAFAHPIEDFGEVDLCLISQRIHGSHFLRPNIDIVLGVDQNANRLVAELHIVAIVNILGIEIIHGHLAIHIVHPPHSSEAKIEDAIIESDIGDETLAFKTKSVVGFGNSHHHVFHRDGFFAEAIAPSQGCVRLSPVDDEHHFILAFANPIADVGGVEGSVLLSKQIGRKQTKDSHEE